MSRRKGKEIDYVAISKTVAHALRHEPELYGLELDDEGWASVASMLEALHEEDDAWASLDEADLHDMIEKTNKRRYEIVDHKIRALYGHSLDIKVLHQAAEPPKFLYHGTSADNADQIMDVGLEPKGRQYVHLSGDPEAAMLVGKRHSAEPVVLMVKANAAHNEGIVFYPVSDGVWLTEGIPQSFLRRFEGDR